MKKKIFLLSAFCLLEVQWSMAQAPKWVDKAKRAVFSVITYGENDKILNTGNGFFETVWPCPTVLCSKERNGRWS